MTFVRCATCEQLFPSRYDLILHYADDHGFDNAAIAVAMDYAPQSVVSKLYMARSRKAKKEARA